MRHHNLILPTFSCAQAYKSDVQRVLKTKADEETTLRQIGKKAAVADVREALATKADASDVKQALSAKAPNADFRALEARVAAVSHIRRFPPLRFSERKNSQQKVAYPHTGRGYLATCTTEARAINQGRREGRAAHRGRARVSFKSRTNCQGTNV